MYRNEYEANTKGFVCAGSIRYTSLRSTKKQGFNLFSLLKNLFSF